MVVPSGVVVAAVRVGSPGDKAVSVRRALAHRACSRRARCAVVSPHPVVVSTPSSLSSKSQSPAANSTAPGWFVTASWIQRLTCTMLLALMP